MSEREENTHTHTHTHYGAVGAVQIDKRKLIGSWEVTGEVPPDSAWVSRMIGADAGRDCQMFSVSHDILVTAPVANGGSIIK